MMNALEFIDVSLNIGSARILNNISFSVERGKIFGLVGHNGAGKTSLLRLLLGLVNTYSGKIKIFSDDELDEKRKCIGAVMDSLSVDKSLTAAQYLRNVGYMLGMTDRKTLADILNRVGLSDTGRKKIARFSLGMKRRLLIAGALVGEPEILVLDEPFNGIDPKGMSEMRLMLRTLSAEGITVLVTSHNIPELIKLASVFGVMHKGDLICSLSDAELAAMNVKKTILKTDDPNALISEMAKAFPKLSCGADSDGEVSVFGDLSINELRGNITGGLIKDIGTASMSEEEILLWKMDGNA